MASLSQPDLTNEVGLSKYLTAKSISHTNVTLLTGGTANYVYRVTSSSSPSSEPFLSQKKTVIYKHAAPYLHSNPSFAFDSKRMDYENHVLTIVPELMRPYLERVQSNVHAVKRYSYDEERRLLCLEDGGEMELKKAYVNLTLDVAEIGAQLGSWLVVLHTSTKGTSLSLTASAGEDEEYLKANNSIGVAIYRHSYANLAAAFTEYGHDVELAKRVNEEFGSRLATDNECVCHGDFWPGNVLVKCNDERRDAVNLTIVDWEMSRRGTSATDVGQFAAEAFLLDRFRGVKGLLGAFLDAYLSSRDFENEEAAKEWAKRVVVHWAVHIAFWPTRVEWADRAGTQSLVDMGAMALKAVLGGDGVQLRDCELLRRAGKKLTRLLA
ncbi:hypothetical protein DM02DRAFT_612726 [Periconia macrospinosa]|uniref:Aminoglycoside phosphotransferase domain-containing protein n=1 Tax=Periconia macrospinosa TaxID=97972 RepID=A0A2V1DZE5_9PLEO|nr:hypothetical protein DM02DRAFT_612726 [Periconia macrospinosa]